MLRSVHITHPAYREYCRGLLGAMVCIKPPQGAQVGAGGRTMEQVRNDEGINSGRDRDTIRTGCGWSCTGTVY